MKKLSSNSFKVSVAPESGADATTYWLVPSVSQVKRSTDGAHLPEYVSCESLSKVGNGNPVSVIGTIKFILTYKTGDTSAEFFYSSRIIITAEMAGISFRLYVGGQLLDEKTVLVVDDGQHGEDGLPGPAGQRGRMPFPSGYWMEDIEYTATGDKTPIVYYEEGKTYYVMNKNGTVIGLNPVTDYTQNGSDATWIPFENYKAIFTEILMANFAKLASGIFHGNYLFSQHGKDALGNATSDYSKFDPSKLGKGDNPFEPNLLLDLLLGKFVGDDMDIKGGKVGGFEIDGYGLVNRKDIDAAIQIDVSRERERSVDMWTTEKYIERRIAALGNILPGSTGIETASKFQMTGYGENTALSLHASKSKELFDGRRNVALSAEGGCDWRMSAHDDVWCMPGFLGIIRFNCNFSDNTYNWSLYRSWGHGIPNVKGSINAEHSLISCSMSMGHTNYSIMAQALGPSAKEGYWGINPQTEYINANDFTISCWVNTRKYIPSRLDIFVFGTPYNKT